MSFKPDGLGDSAAAETSDSQPELQRSAATFQSPTGIGEAPGMENGGPPILFDTNKQKPSDSGQIDLSNPPDSNKSLVGGSRRKKSKSSRVVRKKRTSTHRRRKSRTASAARRRRRRTARK